MYSHTKAKELFDRVADDYEDRCEKKTYNFSSLIFQRRMNLVKNLIAGSPSPGTALDYGMGPAVFGRACVDHGLRYLGIDISPVMVERARALNLKNSEFVVGDLETLKNYRNEMSLVLAIGLIDYLEYLQEGIEALAGAVQPGGHIILSFRNRFALPTVERDAAKRLWNMFSSEDNPEKAFTARGVHEHAVSAGQLKKILGKMGFTPLEVHYFNASPFFFSFPMSEEMWKKWLAFDAKLAGRFTRWMCSGGLLAARKDK
jgi:SAM-dependent methyltransferase